MWEAISSNRRRSWMLIGAMGGLLVLFGAAIGESIAAGFAPVGALIALGVWLLLLISATVSGDSILLMSARAREIKNKEEFPRLWNVVEEMSIASGFGRMPRIFIVEDDGPNAFAVGYRPEKAAVAVTTGLLRRLSRDELQGVIAHEMGHVVNRDIRFMTLAGVMMGAIVLLADLFVRYLWLGGGGRRSSGKGGDGRAQAIMLGVAILAAILAPLFARLLYFACSRKREYLADASAARFTRYPPGLASALNKISRTAMPTGRRGKNRTMAPMYIINPLQARGSTGLFSTHPPTARRIAILQAMAGAEYASYETAYQGVVGGKRHCLGEVTLADGQSPLEIREGVAEPEPKKDAVDRAKEVTDFLGRIGGWAALTCVCGVGIKVPPGFAGDAIPCPRCGHTNQVPVAVEGASDKAAPSEKPLEYRKRGDGWESFRCRCGNTVQISPAHIAPNIVCSKCRRKIRVLGGKGEAAPAP